MIGCSRGEALRYAPEQFGLTSVLLVFHEPEHGEKPQKKGDAGSYN